MAYCCYYYVICISAAQTDMSRIMVTTSAVCSGALGRFDGIKRRAEEFMHAPEHAARAKAAGRDIKRGRETAAAAFAHTSCCFFLLVL
jgi:hypothetical protein